MVAIQKPKRFIPQDFHLSLSTVFQLSQVFGASFICRRTSQPKKCFRFKIVLQYMWMVCYYMALTYGIFTQFRQTVTEKRLPQKMLFFTSHTMRLISNLTVLITCVRFFHNSECAIILDKINRIDLRISTFGLSGIVHTSDSNSRFNMCAITAFLSLNTLILLLDFIDSNGEITEFLTSATVYILPNFSLTLMQLQYVNFMRILKERYDGINALLRRSMGKRKLDNIRRTTKTTDVSDCKSLENLVHELRLIHFQLGALNIRLTKLYGPVLCTMLCSIAVAMIIIAFEFFGLVRNLEPQSTWSISYRLAWITLYGATMLVVLVACEKVSDKVNFNKIIKLNFTNTHVDCSFFYLETGMCGHYAQHDQKIE